MSPAREDGLEAKSGGGNGQERASAQSTAPGQRALAEASKRDVVARFPDRAVVTPMLDARIFYPVKGEESHHHDYYKRSPLKYRFWRWNCGRDRRLRETGGER